MNESARRPIPLVRFVAAALGLALILLALGSYALSRESSASCESDIIGTWHDGPRTYALFHDYGPASDVIVIGTRGEGQHLRSLDWEIRAVGAAKPLPIIELGTVPPGYKQVRSVGSPDRSDLFLLTAFGPDGKIAGGVGSSDDPQRQAMVGSILGGQRHAAAGCYPIP